MPEPYSGVVVLIMGASLLPVAPVPVRVNMYKFTFLER